MYCECEKDACVPEKYYKNEVCTVSTKKMPWCATKDASDVPDYNKRCPDVPCLDILHTLGYEGNTLLYYSPTSLPNSPNL